MGDMDPIIYRKDPERFLAFITLNRPDKFNCVSIELLEALEAALEDLSDDRQVRAVVIDAAGKNFCTGADLVQAREAKVSPEAQRAFGSRAHRVLSKLERVPKPTIAAVQGLALAGGIEIVLTTDIIFMAESARLGDQHAQFGLIPGWGGSQRLPRLIGRRRALDLMYTARWISAADALNYGLANYVVPDDELYDQAVHYAEQLALKNPDGLTRMKDLVLASEDMDLDAGLQLEIDQSVEHSFSENVAEGLAAFHEKRKPNFT